MGNILPILRYFDYPLTLYHWFAKKEKTKDNTVLRKYLATMDLKDFSSYRFSDSSYLLNIELSNNSIYFDYLKRTQPLAIQQYSLLELVNQINFLTSLSDFSEEVLFNYLKEINKKN